MKPFVYFNCVVYGLFKEASSYTGRESVCERERERKNGVLSSAELAISILSIFCSISF